MQVLKHLYLILVFFFALSPTEISIKLTILNDNTIYLFIYDFGHHLPRTWNELKKVAKQFTMKRLMKSIQETKPWLLGTAFRRKGI